MKEVIVHPSPDIWTEIHEVPIPVPGPDEIVIKVIAAGSNVKDWLHITTQNLSLNSGDDIAGTIHAVGSKVASSSSNHFQLGDRVAAFHPMLAPNGAYAEYATAPYHTVLKIPSDTSFEEAATLPLVITTAGLTLFRRQFLPPPWSPRLPSDPPLPLIVYGAGGALGSFAVKLARASNVHPVIAIAGGSTTHLTPLLDSSLGDTLIDYRNGPAAMKAAIKQALGGLEVHHAVDAISTRETWIPLSQLLTPSSSQTPSYLSVVSGANSYEEEDIAEGVQVVYTFVGTAHLGAYKLGMPKQPRDIVGVEGDIEWTGVFFKYLEGMLGDGRLVGHPYEVVAGGLKGVGEGLRRLKAGESRGVKYVYRIGEV